MIIKPGSGLRAQRTEPEIDATITKASHRIIDNEPQTPAFSQPSALSPQPLASGAQRPVLWVVATPIGNLGDLSPRAQEILARVKLILAEDTRHVRKLLNHFAISTPARSLFEHNEEKQVPALVEMLSSGAELALVSDAGTPLLSDPGFRLVRACHERGITVTAVPGPSAITAALSIAGIAPVPFTFAGFLPPKSGARRTHLSKLANLPHTLVFFLSPHRLKDELADCATSLGGVRQAALVAEISKLHERCLRGSLDQLVASFSSIERRGEFTLVVAPPPEAQPSGEVTRERAQEALQDALSAGLSLPDARRAAAHQLGIPRRRLYELLQGEELAD